MKYRNKKNCLRKINTFFKDPDTYSEISTLKCKLVYKLTHFDFCPFCLRNGENNPDIARVRVIHSRGPLMVVAKQS